MLYVWIPLRIHPLTPLYQLLYLYAVVRLALPALRSVVGSPPGVPGLIMLVGELLSYYRRRPLTLLLALDTLVNSSHVVAINEVYSFLVLR